MPKSVAIDDNAIRPLKLARRLEAAGFPAQQAGDMAEATSQLVTKSDLQTAMRDLVERLTIRLGGMLGAATALILTAIGITADLLARLVH
jgi:hypothetical protein